MTMPPRIMVAPNGARRGKADHPALPVTIPEIVACARECQLAGADALHLHVRDAQGRHSLDPGLYAEALTELGAMVPDLPVQITTEAAGIYDVTAQYRCLTKLAPSRASIAVRETARDPNLAPRVYAACADLGTQVQHILYDADDVALLADWRARGIVRPEQSAVLFVLGRYSVGQISSPADLEPLRSAMPEARDWMVCAFGPAEHACLLAAAQLGGACRVGFENSILREDGSRHANNAASVSDLLSKLAKVPS